MPKLVITRDQLGKNQRKPPIMAITLLLDAARAKTRHNRDGLGKRSAEAANHGDQAYSHRDVAKARDNRKGWGKFPRKSPIMAITLYFNRPRAKVSDNSRMAWEKLQRRPPIMAIPKKRGDRIGQTRRDDAGRVSDRRQEGSAPVIAVTSAVGFSPFRNPQSRNADDSRSTIPLLAQTLTPWQVGQITQGLIADANHVFKWVGKRSLDVVDRRSRGFADFVKRQRRRQSRFLLLVRQDFPQRRQTLIGVAPPAESFSDRDPDDWRRLSR